MATDCPPASFWTRRRKVQGVPGPLLICTWLVLSVHRRGEHLTSQSTWGHWFHLRHVCFNLRQPGWIWRRKRQRGPLSFDHVSARQVAPCSHGATCPPRGPREDSGKPKPDPAQAALGRCVSNGIATLALQNEVWTCCSAFQNETIAFF